MAETANNQKQGLYNPANEHDACGVGFVANIHGKKSHEIVEQGLTILDNLTHRGATGYDPKLGDGAGLLSQIPHEFFVSEAQKNDFVLPEVGHYGIGMIFFPQDDSLRQNFKSLIERIIGEEEQTFIGWRDVPVNNQNIADAAKEVEPVIQQVFIKRNIECDTQSAFERKLFVIRKRIEIEISKLNKQDPAKFYIPSLSSKRLFIKACYLLLKWAFILKI